MSKELEVSSLLFADKIEKLLQHEISSNSDFQLGSVEPERIINLFNKSTTILVNWFNGNDLQPVRLIIVTVQSIPHKGDGDAFNVTYQSTGKTDRTIAIVKDEASLESEAKQCFELLKVYALLSLQEVLPDGTTLGSNPKEQLDTLKPPRRALAGGEAVPAEETAKEEAPA